MIGVLIGLAYFLASEMLANSGQVFDLNPAIVTWLPSMALVMVTVFALSRVKWTALILAKFTAVP